METTSRALLLGSESYICETPILLIGFNRPDTMQMVFDEVKKVHPRKLYYAVDCAREGKTGECEKVNQVKEIIKQVDWHCDVHTLFQMENQGCGFGPANAISWAFETEDSLIVLEDDCVPVPTFFSFCDEMLERYKDDERITIIGGRSHHGDSRFFDKQDYIFTHYAHTWGWATWKRCWNKFDIYMKDFPEWLAQGGAYNILSNKKHAKFFNKRFEDVFRTIDAEVSHSWDMQWVYARIKEGGLGIVPCKNLISNIGCGNGTHTSANFKDSPTGKMPKELRHPQFIMNNREYDDYHFKNCFTKKRSLIDIAKSLFYKQIGL